MHRFLLHFTLASLLILTASCTKEEPVQPPPPPPPTEPDTTSHEVDWTITYFEGQGYFRDVIILSDSNVYAIGGVYKNDSTGKQEDHPHNIAHYDGKKWTLKKQSFRSCFGNLLYTPWLDNGIRLTDTNMMFAHTEVLFKTDGVRFSTICTLYPVLDGPLQGLWARSETEIYACGRNGSLALGDGKNFTKMTSPTTKDLKGIYGNKREIWAVAGNVWTGKGGVLYYYGSTWSEIDSLSRNGEQALLDVWCDSKGWSGNGFVAFAGRGIRYFDTTWKEIPSGIRVNQFGLNDMLFNDISGSSRKNIFAGGDFGIIAHYNGKSWHWYPEWYIYPNDRLITCVGVTKDQVFLGGSEDRPFIIHGRMKP